MRRTMKTFLIITLSCTTLLSSFYAYRQRAWADKLHKQLVETNLDDVTIFRALSLEQRRDICRTLEAHGEIRISNWIKAYYGDPLFAQ